ncbi:heterokaryon incompatibility protein-domain-containing protein [Astrocystis sublimbata]|nr:heterokaryon incompatibility protein-domain-containing protein [Astrocystis sublimbata]
MADDLSDSMDTIKERHGRSLVNALMDIEKASNVHHRKPREFMKILDCLYFSSRTDTPDTSAGSERREPGCRPTTLKRKRIDTSDVAMRDYVAVSYTWDHDASFKEPCGKYSVQSHNGDFLESKVRDSVFERVGKYMKYFGDLQYFWIDRHCVVQEEGKAKTEALQAMDLVYSWSKHPIGLLYQPILSVAELKLLAELMSGQLADSEHLSDQRTSETLKLLEDIVSDPWWTRAWTYQEDYSAGERMKLLIPHNIPPEDYTEEFSNLFENIPGEIVLDSTGFYKAASAFCLPLDPPHYQLKRIRKLVLERAGRFTLPLKEAMPGLFPFFDDPANRSMTPYIVKNIEGRQLRVPWDRLSIIANCCQYPVRLDGVELSKKDDQSVSLAILALFLLNGEIFENGWDQPRSHIADGRNITYFFEKYAFSRYPRPQSGGNLTYNKSCRFTDVELTSYGVKTRGHVWFINGEFDTSEFADQLPLAKDGGDPEGEDRRILGLLADKIGGFGEKSSKMHKTLLDYLDRGFDDASKHAHTFAQAYQRSMAKELATAIRQQKPIWFGLIVYAPDYMPDKHSPGFGFFVGNDDGDYGRDDMPMHVFTALRERAAGDDSGLTNDKGRYVSLEVNYECDNEEEEGGLACLLTRRWIHGLCFYDGCPEIDVVFFWPGVLTS